MHSGLSFKCLVTAESAAVLLRLVLRSSNSGNQAFERQSRVHPANTFVPVSRVGPGPDQESPGRVGSFVYSETIASTVCSREPCSCSVSVCPLGVLTPSLTFVILADFTPSGFLYSFFKV